MKTIHVFGIAAAAAIALASLGCDDPAKGKSRATVASAVTIASPTAPAVSGAPSAAPAAAGGTFKFSEAASKIAFVGSKVTGKHDGSFGKFTGSVTLVGGDPTKGSVTVEFDTASITTDTPKLTGHLKSPDFFDVAKFPKAVFTSTSLKAGGDKGATHTVTGNLELHGASKSVTFPATIRLTGDGVEVDAEFSINRKDFGLNYPGKIDDLIRDDVLIRLTIRTKT